MSLRRDLRRFLRAATRALNAYAKKRTPRHPVSDDHGKGADALGKALGDLERDPTLAALDTTPPRSYAGFGDPPAKPAPAPTNE